MTKYRVGISIPAPIYYEVEAENKYHAKEKAYQQFINAEDQAVQCHGVMEIEAEEISDE